MALGKPEKKVYSFRFEEQLVSKLKGFALEENRSFSNFIETILKAYVADRHVKGNLFKNNA